MNKNDSSIQNLEQLYFKDNKITNLLRMLTTEASSLTYSHSRFIAYKISMQFNTLLAKKMNHKLNSLNSKYQELDIQLTNSLLITSGIGPP
ncbi:MAG: hypothetical protein FK734_02890 [Asgard group archaeon]|nr:hypothetical protein [Asgard group archaeon]